MLCWLPITTNLELYNNVQLVCTHSCPGSGVQAQLSFQSCNQNVGWPGFSLEVLKQNPSRLTKVINRIQFQEAVSLGSPFPCWLSSGGHSLLLGAAATHIPSHIHSSSICKRASNLSDFLLYLQWGESSACKESTRECKITSLL